MQHFILIRTKQEIEIMQQTTNTGIYISIERRYYKFIDSRFSNWEKKTLFSTEIKLTLSKDYLKFDKLRTFIQSVTVIMLRLRSSAMINDLCNCGGEWFGEKKLSFIIYYKPNLLAAKMKNSYIFIKPKELRYLYCHSFIFQHISAWVHKSQSLHPDDLKRHLYIAERCG